MGDFGPAYMPQAGGNSQRTPSFRCEECGMQVPIAMPDASCSICGGTLRPAGPAQRAPPTDQPAQASVSGSAPSAGVADAEVQRQAEQILSSILPPELFGDMAGGGPNKPADEEAVASLPLVKIEPYVTLRITRESSRDRRQLLAEAAERRATAVATATTVTAAGGVVQNMEAPHGEEAAVTSSTAEVPGALAPCAPPPLPPPTTPHPEPSRELILRGTGSAFGTSLSEVGEAGVKGAVVVAEPRDGAADFVNAANLQGKVVLMWRGGCSFVDKVRRAQAAGAACACVVQTAGQKWPFTMSDTAGAGTDLLLPSLMINAEDGARLVAELESAGEEPCWGVARAHGHNTSCAVCLQEMIAEEMAVKLPCSHHFHQACVTEWFKKQHTCPCCRSPLPRKESAPSRSPEEASEALRTWADFAVPRGNAPMPSSAMYT